MRAVCSRAEGSLRAGVRTPAADMRDRGPRATRPSDVRPVPSGADSAAMNVARRYPRFRRLLASLAVSQAGDWLYNLALLAFVYERTHSSAWLAVTTAARVLPDRRLRPARRRRRRPLRPPPADARLRRDPLRPHARPGRRRRRRPARRPRADHRRPVDRRLERLHPVRGGHHAAPRRRRRPARRQRRALGHPAGLHRRRPGLRRRCCSCSARRAWPSRSTPRPSRCPPWPSPRSRPARSSRPAASPRRRPTSCASCATAPAPCSSSP